MCFFLLWLGNSEGTRTNDHWRTHPKSDQLSYPTLVIDLLSPPQGCNLFIKSKGDYVSINYSKSINDNRLFDFSKGAAVCMFFI